MTPVGKFKIVKNPVPIEEEKMDSESESEEDDDPTLEITKNNPEEIGESATTIPEPPLAPRKKKRTVVEWEEKVGSRFSTRER